MKNTLLVALGVVLILALGIETGYLLKSHMDRRNSAENIYSLAVNKSRPSVKNVRAMAGNPSASFTWQRRSDPFFGEDIDHWDPFQEMEDMQRMMNRMFQSSFSRGLQTGALSGHTFSYSPDMDIKDAGKEYLVRVDLPGIDKDKIRVKVEQNEISISGERSVEKNETNDQSGLYRSERSFGSFSRTIPLPADALSDGIRAESANGVLTVHIPKLEHAKSDQKSVVVE